MMVKTKNWFMVDSSRIGPWRGAARTIGENDRGSE